MHSEPTLLYRTGKEQWSPPRGPGAQRRLKELCAVFTHPIAKVWNHDLGWKVVGVMDAHTIRFTTIDIVRFKKVEVNEVPEDEEGKKPVVGPVTIWIGVFPESTSATAAHDAAQNILALLKDYQITDVDIDFRESFYTREIGPQLLKPIGDLEPLVDVDRPDAQGTMALYLAEGGGSDRLLGLSCRHILIGSKEATIDYVHHPGGPPKDVLLLDRKAFTNLVDSIKLSIGEHGITVKRWRKQIEQFKEREKGTNAADVEKAKAARIKTRVAGQGGESDEGTWSVAQPAITLGAGEHRFTEDWGIIQVNRSKLGNKIDLGTKLDAGEFTVKCFPHGDANWEFEYPQDRLFPLVGTITDDMWDSDGEPCLLVIKSGNATGTTIGRANDVFSIVRDYINDMSVSQTSMEWGIIKYDSKLEVFLEPGDSGSAIADIRGRIGGMLTGGSGKTKSSNMTYATPFWWLLECIRANGFPNAHLSVVA